MTFQGKNIAILGGSGTLGRALVKELIQYDPQMIAIVSRDEIKQLEMMELFGENPLTYKLGDVRDYERIKEVLQDTDFVIHAAAIKHVVMAEKNPEECHKTNVLGTENVIKACQSAGIKKAIFISTDKAVNPLGAYGKTKAMAESLWKNANAKGECSFGIVRLGNIIGARGSVFEVFEKQRTTGTLKVTHPDATRFCISQDEAARFILEAIESEGDSIFTPKMQAFRIVDLAREIAPECEIEFVGLRPGDKLHEELEEGSSFDFVAKKSATRLVILSK